MSLKHFFGGVLTILVIGLVFFYWFMPFNEVRFGTNKNPEFSVGNISSSMQFYPNMRFLSPKISYEIDNSCSLKKKKEMRDAFSYMENVTSLSFYPVYSNPEINVTCQEESKTTNNGMFIAGEGGPTKIISGDNFNIIYTGKILLLRESNCERPNVEIHELLHVLGFDHSKNPNNIMYPVSKCSQTLGQEIPNKINELYSFPQLPDLKIQNVSAKISGRYLDVKLSVQNIGLKDTQSETLKIYGDDNLLKEMNLKEINVGYGLDVSLTNIWVSSVKIKNIKIVVETTGSELSLENNQVTLSTSS